MSHGKCCLLLLLLLPFCNVFAQPDSASYYLSQMPGKYFSEVNKKIEKYNNRLSTGTEKTLVKLSRWENKVRQSLQQINPEAAARLFKDKDATFEGLLNKLREGKTAIASNAAGYSEYNDNLSTALKYIQTQRNKIDTSLVQSAGKLSKNLTSVQQAEATSEAVEKFIKERKRQLILESVKYLGKSKYLKNINKESYYYTEAVKNYKELFSNPKDAEKKAMELVNNIPAFKKFFQKNSQLAGMFGNTSLEGSAASLGGLQTRSGINALLQDRISQAGAAGAQAFTQNMQAAQAQLSQLKTKLLNNIPSNGEGDLPDFKPNTQKAKTFGQRLEYIANVQFNKTAQKNAAANFALGIGYKLNDRSAAGFAISYELGFGSIQRLSLQSRGIGLRSYADWKLKKQIFFSGGFEFNHENDFESLSTLKSATGWQKSALMGLMKKIPSGKKFGKEMRFQLLYDLLSNSNNNSAVVFRMGYGF
ncbi:MAG: hypothetical protein H7Y86_21995 [Rhizobacter sp.]|nr:hypothetical protein [Ferruginibacter sp.]